MMEKMTVNLLPSPTWRWLKVNNIELPVIPGEETVNVIDIPAGHKPEKAMVFPDMLGDSDKNERVKLTIGEGAKLAIIMDRRSEGKGHLAKLAVDYNLAKDSELTLVEIVRMNPADSLHSSYEGELSDNARLKVIQVYLSGRETFTNIHCTLRGEGSYFGLNSAYTAGAGQSIDINYVVDHFGKNTECDLKSLGVLYGGASKVYRGTIDFKNGCKGAVGNETEDVLLMEDDIINKTVPIILCAEEDVEGNHGATIGRISEDLMFYLESRGIPGDEIYDMLARGRMDAVIKLIPHLELQGELLNRK